MVRRLGVLWIALALLGLTAMPASASEGTPACAEVGASCTTGVPGEACAQYSLWLVYHRVGGQIFWVCLEKGPFAP